MFRPTLFLWTLALTGCASSHLAVVEPSRASDKATFERLCALAGTWQSTDPEGKVFEAAVFKVSSNGSSVVETMFPGSPFEMTNVYHLDGPSVVLTHYCAAGNQPRMRATNTDGENVAFEFDSVSNVTDANAEVMSSLEVHFVDADHIVQTWGTLKKVLHPEPVVFTLERKR